MGRNCGRLGQGTKIGLITLISAVFCMAQTIAVHVQKLPPDWGDKPTTFKHKGLLKKKNKHYFVPVTVMIGPDIRPIGTAARKHGGHEYKRSIPQLIHKSC